MKKPLYIVPLLLGMALISCHDEDIEKINDRLDALENTQIASINQQITSINNSIMLLNGTDKELGAYITALEAKAENMQTQLSATNTKIEEMKQEILSAISNEKATILAELEAFKASVNGEVEVVNAVLETLKAKDVELVGQIADLKAYVDTELKATEDWATITFATLEQYNTVVSTIATIEGTIEGLNESLAALETRINEKIAKDIETACATLSADLQKAVDDVTEEYTAAIATATEEIIAAYTAKLESAISALETSMREWVNEQLTGYYTIAEMDAKLEVLKVSATEGDSALQKEIASLKEDLADQRTELTEAYTKAIEEAITKNRGLVDDKIAEEVCKVNEQIADLEKRLDVLEERIAKLEESIRDVEEQISALVGRIQSISYVPKYSDGKASIDADKKIGVFDFQISPKDAVAGLEKVWESALSMQAVHTQTRAVEFIELPITYFEPNVANGTFAIEIDATNLGDDFFVGNIEASVALHISDGNNEVTSAYINLALGVVESLVKTEHPAPDEIWYTSTNDEIVEPYWIEDSDGNSIFGAAPISNTYENGHGVIKFNGSVTSIGYGAFYECINLANIIIPDSVTEIGMWAFYGCTSLQSVYCKPLIPPMAQLNLGNWEAFKATNSDFKIYVPAVSKDAYKTIDYWKDYAEHIFEEDTDAPSLEGVGNVIYYTSSIKEEVNEECFDSPILSHTFENGVGVITFYDEITKIGNDAEDNYDSAFWRNDFMGNSSITSITLPNSIISIGRLAFSDCMALKHIVLPSNLEYIGLSAFWGCSSLESITIPNSVTTIDNYAFIDCDALTKVVIPNNVESIGVAAFSRCDNLEVFEGKFAADNGRCLIVNGQLNSVITGLTEYVIPDGVTSLGVSVFDNRGKINSGVAGDSYAQLTHIVIPNTVTEIGDYAFRHCVGLTSITIPNSVTSIGNSAFYGCSSLASVTIPDSVASIGSDAFYGCSSLKEFKGKFASTDGYCLIIDGVLVKCAPAAAIGDYAIPNTVTSIGSYAFRGCSNISSITIPNSVSSIGYMAFDCPIINCEAIVPPTIDTDCFNNCQIIVVPEESVEEYRTQWSDYALIIISAGGDPTLIYRDNFDKKLAEQETKWPPMSSEYGNPWPDNQMGVTYSSQGVTVRTNGPSNGNYSDYGGSGGNNLFFGSSSSGITYFMIKDISLDALDGNSLSISFGTYKSQYLLEDIVFKKNEFHVYVSGDGEKWSEIEYEFAPEADLDSGRWNRATSLLSFKEVPTNLSVLMVADLTAAYRIDDLLIMNVNNEGAEIDLSMGVNIDVTIPDEEDVGSVIQTSVANFLIAPEDNTIYELTGKITRVGNVNYGNFDLTDKSGTIWIYGLKDSTGTGWVNWDNIDLSEGDTITIQGKRSSYNGTPEMKNALYVSHTKNKEDGNENDSQGDGNTNEDEIEPDKPIVTDGVYSSDSAFVPSADDSTTRVYVLDETKIDNNLVTGFKLGTNRQTGVFTSGVINKPGDKYLNFYAVAWKGGTTTLYWRVDDGAVHRQQLTPNDGATGNPPYEITFADTDHYSVLLTGLTENSVIEFSTSENFEVVAVEPTPPATMPSNTRAIVCGVKLTDKPIAPSNNLGQ